MHLFFEIFEIKKHFLVYYEIIKYRKNIENEFPWPYFVMGSGFKGLYKINVVVCCALMVLLNKYYC